MHKTFVLEHVSKPRTMYPHARHCMTRLQRRLLLCLERMMGDLTMLTYEKGQFNERMSDFIVNIFNS